MLGTYLEGNMGVGLFGLIRAVKGMKERGDSAVMRIWMPELNERNIRKVLDFVSGKGMAPIDVSLAHRPTVDEIAASGDEYPQPTPIALDALRKVDDAMEPDKVNVIVFRDYDITGDEVRREVLAALNNHGFTPNAWPETTMLFMIDVDKHADTAIIDLPADSLDPPAEK